MSDSELKDALARMLVEASEGSIGYEDARDEKSSLVEKGYPSIAFLNYVDLLEDKFGVYIDLEEDTDFLGELGRTVEWLRGQGVE